MKVALGRWPIAALLIGGFLTGVPARSAWAHPPPMTTELSIFGNPIIYRFGVKQDYFVLTGTGLPKAFEGVPEAVALAERYQWWLNGGNVASVVGNVLIVGGVYYRLKELDGPEKSNRSAAWYSIIGGAVLAGGGAFASQAAKRLIYQAINVFNDRFEPGFTPEVRGDYTDTGHPEGQFLLTYEIGR